MKAWRAILGMSLLFGSYLGLFFTMLYIKDPNVQVLFFFLTLIVGMFALILAQNDGQERKIVDPEQIGQIRRESRKRCLDELEAITCDKNIESGVGVDVARAYSLAVIHINKADINS